MNLRLAVTIATGFLASLCLMGRASGAASPASLHLTSCQIEGLPVPAHCGSIDVPENPQHPDARHLTIRFAVLRATGGRALSDPIVPLMGGPGEAAISEASRFADQLSGLRKDRDLLLVDQRGAGRSGALNCDLYSPGDPQANLQHLFALALVSECENRLKLDADLTQYTYENFARDLEQVRLALGYGKLNLFAGSYGTRAAQVFIRTFPASVRTAYLGSVVPIDIATPGEFAAASQSALERMFDACLADTGCKTAYPNLRAEFKDVVSRLDLGTAQTRLADGSAVTLDRGRVAEWFRSRLYRPSSAVELPWLIHQASQGNWRPIAEGILESAKAVSSALSFGLFFAITCSDDVPFVTQRQLTASQQGFLRDYRFLEQQAACRFWPKVPAVRAAITSSVPTLFVSGDSDGGTPLSFMEHAAKGFAASRSIIQRGQGHTEWDDCISGIYVQFIRIGSVSKLEPESCPAHSWPPFRLH